MIDIHDDRRSEYLEYWSIGHLRSAFDITARQGKGKRIAYSVLNPQGDFVGRFVQFTCEISTSLSTI